MKWDLQKMPLWGLQSVALIGLQGPIFLIQRFDVRQSQYRIDDLGKTLDVTRKKGGVFN